MRLISWKRKARSEGQLEELRVSWNRSESPVVSAEDIAELVSMWTGIPVMQMAAGRIRSTCY